MDITWLIAIVILTVIFFCIIKKIISLGGLVDLLLGIIPFAGLIVDMIILEAGFLGSVLIIDYFNNEIQFGIPIITTASVILLLLYAIIKGVLSLGGLVNFLLGFIPKIDVFLNILSIIISMALTFTIIWAGINCFEQGKDFYNQNLKPKNLIKKSFYPAKISILPNNCTTIFYQ